MSISDIEQQLYTQGTGIGHKLLELQCLREKQGKGEGKRQNRLIGILTFISSDVWKGLFGKAADSLEKSNEDEDEYMIHEAEPVTNQFVSVPQSMGNLNCAAFVSAPERRWRRRRCRWRRCRYRRRRAAAAVPPPATPLTSPHHPHAPPADRRHHRGHPPVGRLPLRGLGAPDAARRRWDPRQDRLSHQIFA